MFHDVAVRILQEVKQKDLFVGDFWLADSHANYAFLLNILN